MATLAFLAHRLVFDGLCNVIGGHGAAKIPANPLKQSPFEPAN